MPTKAEYIADNMINGNRGIARAALKNAKGKVIVLDVLEQLAEYKGGYQSSIEDLRSLLSV